ncbi:XkdX family protein [Bacillus altitudinis]
MYPDYETIKQYYNWDYYEDFMMRDFVSWGHITQQEYEVITGKKF